MISARNQYTSLPPCAYFYDDDDYPARLLSNASHPLNSTTTKATTIWGGFPCFGGDVLFLHHSRFTNRHTIATTSWWYYYTFVFSRDDAVVCFGQKPHGLSSVRLERFHALSPKNRVTIAAFVLHATSWRLDACQSMRSINLLLNDAVRRYNIGQLPTNKF